MGGLGTRIGRRHYNAAYEEERGHQRLHGRYLAMVKFGGIIVEKLARQKENPAWRKVQRQQPTSFSGTTKRNVDHEEEINENRFTSHEDSAQLLVDRANLLSFVGLYGPGKERGKS